MTDTPQASIPVQHMRHDLLMALRSKSEAKTQKQKEYYTGLAFGLASALMYLAAEGDLAVGVYEWESYSGTMHPADYERLRDYIKDANFTKVMGQTFEEATGRARLKSA